jgi:hypothetical protein
MKLEARHFSQALKPGSSAGNVAIGAAAPRALTAAAGNIAIETGPDGRLSESEAQRLVDWADINGIDLREDERPKPLWLPPAEMHVAIGYDAVGWRDLPFGYRVKYRLRHGLQRRSFLVDFQEIEGR